MGFGKMKILYLDNLAEPQAHGHIVIKWLNKMGHIVYNNKAIAIPDMVLVIRGEHQDIIKLRKQYKCPIVLWNWEPPGIPYLSKEKLDLYDLVFNSSKANNEWVKNRTITPCVWLPQPIDPDIFRPLNIKKEIDVLYMGTYSPVRYNWIQTLVNLKEFKITVVGNGWVNTKPVYLENLNFLMNKARCCLVLPSWSSPNFTGTDIKGRHYSLKNMMILASGTPMVYPEEQDFPSVFEDIGYFGIPYWDLESCYKAIKTVIKCPYQQQYKKAKTYEEQLNRIIEEVHKLGKRKMG